MSAAFQFNEKANSEDLSDEDVASAISTSRSEDIAEHLNAAVCPVCAKTLYAVKHEKRFRFPHFYWRARMKCVDEHPHQLVFQVTWLYKPTT